MQRKISLVLGSGGARGITQIGIIRWLTDQGYEIDEIVGSSIGSLVGAAFASGKINELSEWMSRLTRKEVFRLMDFSNPIYGVLKGQRVLLTLQEVFADCNIEDFAIKYTAVATDLVTETEVLFETGSVYAAIRASIAIPAVFQPVSTDHQFLVDGGVLNPVPVNHVQHKENIIIAVNLDGYPNRATPKDFHKLNAIELLQESYQAMRRQLSLLSLELNKPDYLINIPDNISGIWEFDKSSALIEQGYTIANERLKELILK